MVCENIRSYRTVYIDADGHGLYRDTPAPNLRITLCEDRCFNGNQ